MPKRVEKPSEPSKPSRGNALALLVLAHHREKHALAAGEEAFLQAPSGQLYLYNGRFWEPLTEPSARALVGAVAPDLALTSDQQRGEAVKFIGASCHRHDHRWGRVTDHEVPCRNGVVDVLTGALRRHRASDFLESVIPWDYDPAASAPAFEAYLSRCFGDGEDERLPALQSFSGYVVLSHARYKKALVLYGLPDTGKTQFVLMLQQLVGQAFTCSLSVEQMDDPVERVVLVGKRLNVLTELPAEALIRDGGFKALVSTEDPIHINPKYREPFLYTPVAKHVIATNELPRINDRTMATINRLYIVPFTQVIPLADRDPDLQEKLAREMPGILAWAIRGARLLVEARGVFPRVEAAQAEIARLREESNPVISFIAEMLAPDPAAAVPLSSLTQAFNKWNGGKRLDVRQMGKLVRAAQHATKKVWNGSASVQSLVGFRMRADGEDLVDPPPAGDAAPEPRS